jgi:ferredoxin-NADP reductase
VLDADNYICVPVPFLRKQVGALKTLGVAESWLYQDLFGTADSTSE